jgi:hypothetical protein
MALETLHPPASGGLETSDNLATVPFLAQRVLARKREWLNGPGFLAIQNATGPANLLSQGTGTAALAEIASAEVCGFTFDADSESHGFLWGLPDIIDVSEDINLIVAWSETNAAVAGSALFSIVYTPLTLGTTAIAVGATALNTILVDDPDSATEDAIQQTEVGIIAGKTLTGKPGVDLLAVKVAVDLTTANNATYWGVLGDYGRRYI